MKECGKFVVAELTPHCEQLREAACSRQLSLAKDESYVASAGVFNSC